MSTTNPILVAFQESGDPAHAWLDMLDAFEEGEAIGSWEDASIEFLAALGHPAYAGGVDAYYQRVDRYLAEARVYLAHRAAWESPRVWLISPGGFGVLVFHGTFAAAMDRAVAMVETSLQRVTVRIRR